MFVTTRPMKMLPLLVIFITLLQAHGNPVQQQQQQQQQQLQSDKYAEIQDLNKAATGQEYTTQATNKSQTISLEETEEEIHPKPFSHRDEDDVVPNALDDRYKYDVEILENSERVQEGKNDLEERFRGSALKVNPDTIFPENIETNIEPSPADRRHRLVGYALLVFGFVALLCCGACFVWRRHLDARYRSRVLLETTNDDDDDYLRQAHMRPPPQ